jgi:hypothetical protein
LQYFWLSIFTIVACVGIAGSRQRQAVGAVTMKVNSEGSRGELPSNSDDQVISERVQELTWAMLDEQITDDEFGLLDTLLLSDETARQNYVGCVQLHAELVAHFAEPATKTTASGTQVLGFLSGDSSPGLPSSGGEVLQ